MNVLDLGGLRYFYQQYIKSLKEKVEKMTRTTISTTIPASRWTGASAPYTVNITVAQLTGAADELVEVEVQRYPTAIPG